MFSKPANLKLEKEFEEQRIKTLEITKKLLDMYQGAVSANKALFVMISKNKNDADYYPSLTIEQQKNFERNYQDFENTINKQLAILNCLENNYTQQTKLRSNKKEALLDVCNTFKLKIDEGYQTFHADVKAYNFFRQVLADRAIKYAEELKTLIESPKAKTELAELKAALSR